jgi:hypothetical protein
MNISGDSTSAGQHFGMTLTSQDQTVFNSHDNSIQVHLDAQAATGGSIQDVSLDQCDELDQVNVSVPRVRGRVPTNRDLRPV